jgi:hypothetical protein
MEIMEATPMSRRLRHSSDVLAYPRADAMRSGGAETPSAVDGIANRAAWRLKEQMKTLLPDLLFLSLLHRKLVGRYPNLRRPRTFNEHILMRSLKPDPRYAALTDKIAVRDYVVRTLGESYLIPLIAVPGEFTREVFNSLPQSFVMKATHGSTFVEIVRDKSEVTYEHLAGLADRWLTTEFYHVSRERHYKEIQPRLFFEKLLLDRSGQVPADYKVHVFRRKGMRPVMYIVQISDRFGPFPRGNVYDVDWNYLDVTIGDYARSATPEPPPPNLSEILVAADKLSRDFDYVRVDLYAPDNALFFGELTFTPGAGVVPMFPDQVDFAWGELMDACS